MGDSSMRCSEEFLDEVHKRKDRTQSYEDYLWELLEQEDEPAPAPPAPEPEPVSREPQPEPRDRDGELLAWVRENQPVTREEILEECVPEDYPHKADSWWQRNGRPRLKASGAEYTIGIGWSFD